jgi:hypothetical protein
MLRNKISSNINVLDKLNKIYPWIPNSTMIRPNSKDLEKKMLLTNEINNEWYSFKDYLMYKIFQNDYEIDENGKKYIKLINNDSKTTNTINDEWFFSPSLFRYDLVGYSNHWILWNNQNNFEYEPPENIITKIIETKIFNIIHNDSFEFVWYKNPKPSVKDFYHIQVFWICNF